MDLSKPEVVNQLQYWYNDLEILREADPRLERSLQGFSGARRGLLLLRVWKIEESALLRRLPQGHNIQASIVQMGEAVRGCIPLRVQKIQESASVRWHSQQQDWLVNEY